MSEYDEREAEFQRRLTEPVTVGELSQALHYMHLALLSHSAFEGALLEGDEKLQRELGEKAVKMAGNLLDLNRRLLRLPERNDG